MRPYPVLPLQAKDISNNDISTIKNFSIKGPKT